MHPIGMAHSLREHAGREVRYDNVPGDVVMLDAKPIPGTGEVVAIFSPGHGRREHMGFVTVVDPRRGPVHQPSAGHIHPGRGKKAASPIINQ